MQTILGVLNRKDLILRTAYTSVSRVGKKGKDEGAITPGFGEIRDYY
jgi:hypothetical protein